MQKRVSINDLSKRSGTRFEINEMLAKERSDHAAAICGGDLNDVPATMLMPLSSRTTFNYRNKIAPVCQAVHDSTHARTEALNEFYNPVAFAVALRVAHGFTTSKNKLGREAGEVSRINPNKLFNCDTSSHFLGDDDNLSKVFLAAGSQDALQILNRTATTTSSMSSSGAAAQPCQQRSVQYLIVVSASGRAHSCVISIKDSSFPKESARLYKVCDLFTLSFAFCEYTTCK